MMMDPGEIVRTYKAAKDPKEQVKILAELNCTSTKAIAVLLQDAGCQVDKRYLAGNPHERTSKQPETYGLTDHELIPDGPEDRKPGPELPEDEQEARVKSETKLNAKKPEGCWLTKTEAIVLADMIETGTFDAIRNDPEINSIDWLIGICHAYEKLRSATR